MARITIAPIVYDGPLMLEVQQLSSHTVNTMGFWPGHEMLPGTRVRVNPDFAHIILRAGLSLTQTLPACLPMG